MVSDEKSQTSPSVSPPLSRRHALKARRDSGLCSVVLSCRNCDTYLALAFSVSWGLAGAVRCPFGSCILGTDRVLTNAPPNKSLRRERVSHQTWCDEG